MSNALQHGLLEALLNTWDRAPSWSTCCTPCPRAASKVMEGSPSIAELFAHIRYVRLSTVAENATKFTQNHPEFVLYDDQEWKAECDPIRIAQMHRCWAKVLERCATR